MCARASKFSLFLIADRAYTLLNGVSSRAGVRLQFKMNSPLGDCPEPEAQAGLLNIKNLPIHINNKSLYDLFRPFGPMILCKILVEQGSTFKGTALVQYFHSEDAKVAESSMVMLLFIFMLYLYFYINPFYSFCLFRIISPCRIISCR